MNSAVIIGGLGGIGNAFTNAIRNKYPSISLFVTTRKPSFKNTSQSNGTIIIPSVDITNEISVENAAKQIASKSPQGINLIINCAGLLHTKNRLPERSIQQFSPDFMMENLAVNTIGSAIISKQFESLLVKGTSPNTASKLVNLSARVGSIEDNKLGGWVSYRASKAAQNQVTRTFSIEFKRKNVITVAMHPGTVDTTLSAPFRVQPKVLQSPDKAVGKMLNVIEGLTLNDTGKFYDYNGKSVPW